MDVCGSCVFSFSQQEFIKAADRDADGKVNFYEFYRFMLIALDVKVQA